MEYHPSSATAYRQDLLTRTSAPPGDRFSSPAAPGGFTGERFLEQCAPVLARPEAMVTGLHVYTFNQVAETEAWRRAYLDRLMAVR